MFQGFLSRVLLLWLVCLWLWVLRALMLVLV